MTEQTDHARRERTRKFAVRLLTLAAEITEAIAESIRESFPDIASPGEAAPDRVTVPDPAPTPNTSAHAALWGAVRDASVIDVGTAEELQRCGLDIVTEFTPEWDDEPRRPVRWRNPGMHDTNGMLVDDGADANDMAVLRSVANRLAPALADENAERHTRQLAAEEAQRVESLRRRGLDPEGNDLPGVERPSKLGSVESILLHVGAPAVVLGDPDGAETTSQVATPVARVEMMDGTHQLIADRSRPLTPYREDLGGSPYRGEAPRPEGKPVLAPDWPRPSCPICYRTTHTVDQANECGAVVADHTINAHVKGNPTALAAWESDIAEVHAVEIVEGQR